MIAIEPVYHCEQPGAQVITAVRHLGILAEALTEECCQQVETALVLCREETSRRACADEFFAASYVQVGELRALLLLLCAAGGESDVDAA
ncbi:hypothetical protein [Mycobacteroides abscessus]|uniref:hypothetical protein n=1 Tax=Mycobacteroides abscessus TaxID=36809 RepID=UPI000926E680|nr:hypothetical protein [Mycobacteroides abscessus]SHU84263.1 Uncharacterised protein [Mycobacteroides abscessus subsp. bolletii]SHW20073.1 Uncharacterised protein [Mycobacteroides abscessus subsp. bolletii]SHW50855.1 Uncharacterised protein [Mycobacteroides abscessus subsp. bolletii]SHX94727.1 Uncharacterised protein [Mycobacteroides abscessus subsp. bolletii]SKS67182.1 Uncharacterised protein [Mycobacteroides abscessus subsp. bolletii]